MVYDLNSRKFGNFNYKSFRMWVFFFRIGILGVALLAWVAFQLVRKGKKWRDIQGDALMAVSFITIWGFVYYLIIA